MEKGGAGGRGKGADRSVPVGDMASVHLSISKHSQLSSLSTGGEVIPFFPSLLLCIALLSASPHHTPPRTHHLFLLLLRPFLPFHLTATLLYLLYTPLLFVSVFFPAFPHLFFHLPIPTPPYFSSPSPHLPGSQWNGPFSNKTKLPTASHAG